MNDDYPYAGPIKPEEEAVFETTAQAMLELMGLRGIEYFFANAGTDFASIIDAFAYRHSQGSELPRPVTVPHETPLMGMAHGYYMVTGKPQVAMVHVGVGTANGVGALMAAHRARVPILFAAGRTPVTESGFPASRSAFIHWGQESYDQAGLVREYVKWDYELRTPIQLETVVDRALLMAMSEPRGPIYLTLPREVLATPFKERTFNARHRYDLPRYYPDPQKISEAADLLLNAEFPLIITSALGRTPAAVQSLVNLAEAGGIGVVSFNPEYMNFPLDHPCHMGFSSQGPVAASDVICVVDCDVPWYPNQFEPRAGAKIIQVGIDPYYSAYPIRSFPSDLTIQADSGPALSELGRVLSVHPGLNAEIVAARKKKLEKMHLELTNGFKEKAQAAADDLPLDMAWVSHQLTRFLDEDTLVVNEYDNAIREQTNPGPGRYFGNPHAGYLGWGVGAALGAKLASPDKTVIATVGDGCYMFAVPSACHFVSQAQKLPILVMVYNNQGWHAVKSANRAVHPEGWAVQTNRFPLCDLDSAAQYEKVCEAFGGYGERVESPEQVGPALARALHAVKVEKRQALLNVICKHV